MADDEHALHYPPGAEPEKPAEEAKPEVPAPEEEKETPEPTKPDDSKAEDDKPEPEKEKEEAPPADPPLKRRSIYDDYKDKKDEAKELKQIAVTALQKAGITVKGNESAAELQALLQAGKEADTPKAKAEVKDDLTAFAEAHEMSPETLQGLIEIVGKRVGASSLSDEDKAALADARRLSQQASRQAEDAAVMSAASTIKTELSISDDAELAKVMAEVVKLSHTAKFHDKEVEYIVWANKAELSKLVSPKKASFEAPGGRHEAQEGKGLDLKTGKGMSPIALQDEIEADLRSRR